MDGRRGNVVSGPTPIGAGPKSFKEEMMTSGVHGNIKCDCGRCHSYADYVFAYWENEVERICVCGKPFRISTGNGRVLD